MKGDPQYSSFGQDQYFIGERELASDEQISYL
jgi:hypothetical protein